MVLTEDDLFVSIAHRHPPYYLLLPKISSSSSSSVKLCEVARHPHSYSRRYGSPYFRGGVKKESKKSGTLEKNPVRLGCRHPSPRSHGGPGYISRSRQRSAKLDLKGSRHIVRATFLCEIPRRAHVNLNSIELKPMPQLSNPYLIQ